MTTSSPYAPRDLGTAIASCIAIVFISYINFNSFNTKKTHIHNLSKNTWYQLNLNKTDYLQFDFLKFRTGDISINIKQYQRSIYTQPCHRFATLCESMLNQHAQLQNVIFYSNTPKITAISILILKSLSFIDENQQS